MRDPETLRVEIASIDEFVAAEPIARFCRLGAMRELEYHAVPMVTELIERLADGNVARYLERQFGVGLAARPLFDVARYRCGDFLRPHHDADGRRAIGFVFYLSTGEWRPGCGGEFGYRNEARDISRIPPLHNTATLMVFRSHARHWVEPVQGDYQRFAIAAHYLSA